MTSPMVLGRSYFEACAGRDWAALRALLSDDVRWVFPGESSAAAPAAGIEATMTRIERVCSFLSGFGLAHVLASRSNFALTMHRAIDHERLDDNEQLAVIGRVRDGRIVEIETFVSNLEVMDLMLALDPPPVPHPKFRGYDRNDD